ncbi:MAG: hypothetical protein WCK94_03165 [Comamonadaceae bacterium]
MPTLGAMFTSCPKCGHKHLPSDQALPASCPACGVILAKVGHPVPAKAAPPAQARIDPITFWPRLALLTAFAVWGVVLIAQDYRTGEIGSSFLHRPLLIFHEAGHVVFRLLGQWMMVLGGSLGQLLMPAILGGALLLKNRDPFGASIGLWFFGVSLLDLAPYMYDALNPQLLLLSGRTGEEGGHDWIFLFSSMGLLQKAPLIGALVHKLGALTVIAALCWGARALRLDHVRAGE